VGKTRTKLRAGEGTSWVRENRAWRPTRRRYEEAGLAARRRHGPKGRSSSTALRAAATRIGLPSGCSRPRTYDSPPTRTRRRSQTAYEELDAENFAKALDRDVDAAQRRADGPVTWPRHGAARPELLVGSEVRWSVD
jgi:hypothetical protein